MYTKCPECSAVFLVTTEQLNMAGGLVRCGICDSVFNGRDNFEEDRDLKVTPANNLEPWHQESDQNLIEDQWPNEDTDSPKLNQQNDDDALTDAERIPTVIRDDFGSNILTKTNSPFQTAVFTLGAITLTIFFLGQISYWQDVGVLPRTWVNSYCKIFVCDNDIRELSAIRILNRNIYTHPNVKKALMITTSFVNQSEYPQAYPLLKITLLDTHGKIVAVRRFSPKDYLVNKSLVDTLMVPNQPVGARLEVLDPGNKVIAYEFDFN